LGPRVFITEQSFFLTLSPLPLWSGDPPFGSWFFFFREDLGTLLVSLPRRSSPIFFSQKSFFFPPLLAFLEPPQQDQTCPFFSVFSNPDLLPYLCPPFYSFLGFGKFLGTPLKGILMPFPFHPPPFLHFVGVSFRILIDF